MGNEKITKVCPACNQPKLNIFTIKVEKENLTGCEDCLEKFMNELMDQTMKDLNLPLSAKSFNR